MKRIGLSLLLLLPALALAGTKPVSCDLGPAKQPRVAEISRAGKIEDTYVYSLRQGKAAKATLWGGESDDSRGSEVKVKCVGDRQRALAVMGDFMSAGYPRGLVLVYDTGRRAYERFDFAERNAPGWLYLGAKDRLLVFPPGGRLETERRYLVYRFAAGAGQDNSEEMVDALPKADGYRVIKIDL
ncbi:hypothetical protein AZ78_2539 [Lysobacter capsici AZ78]|uniref:Uncharacterized protein n=1 Tax=Lysobacter capsici AZ78 TaxID=1444315 RepID=A0A108U9F1_9GAMM|nr:hypothetical protein [Lysobacter capsici]KWS04989.1 hypothetical protein AZ78_2539 [Lysobacter capsici AZ78]